MKKRVTYLAIALTTECNYKCFYCKRGGESISKEKETISFSDIKKIIANAHEIGITNFRITGGEPTSVPYFGKLIEYIMKFKDTKIRIIISFCFLLSLLKDFKGICRLTIGLLTRKVPSDAANVWMNVMELVDFSMLSFRQSVPPSEPCTRAEC